MESIDHRKIKSQTFYLSREHSLPVDLIKLHLQIIQSTISSIVPSKTPHCSICQRISQTNSQTNYQPLLYLILHLQKYLIQTIQTKPDSTQYTNYASHFSRSPSFYVIIGGLGRRYQYSRWLHLTRRSRGRCV